MNPILPFPLSLYLLCEPFVYAHSCVLSCLINFFILVFFLCDRARAQRSTSLYIPGFDPQPVSADVIGVGSDGRTTWALHKGKTDPTDTSSYPDFVGTGKLRQFFAPVSTSVKGSKF
jgi:hypothetical protein